MGQQAYFANLAIISQAVLRTVRDHWHPSFAVIVFLLIFTHKTGLHQNHAGSCQPTQHAGRFRPARTPQQPDSGTRSLQACSSQLWCPAKKHLWYGHGHRPNRRHVQGQNAGTTRRHRASTGMYLDDMCFFHRHLAYLFTASNRAACNTSRPASRKNASLRFAAKWHAGLIWIPPDPLPPTSTKTTTRFSNTSPCR